MSDVLTEYLRKKEREHGREFTPAELYEAYATFPELQNDSVLALELLEHIADAAVRSRAYELAVRALQRATEISPDPISFVALGDALRSIGQIEEAKVAYDTAMQTAKANNRLRIYASDSRLRLCIATNDTEAANIVLEDLVSLLKIEGVSTSDVKPEADLIEGLKAIGVKSTLLDEYGDVIARLTKG